MRITAASRTLAVLVPLAVALAVPAAATAAVRAQQNPDAVSLNGFQQPTVLEEPSPWVPLVTEDPVPAASALVPATVAHGPWNRETGRGFVVLSADGTQYRRLPYRETGSEPVGAISPDGRWVAQVDRVLNPLRPALPVVTLLRLGDRSTRDVVLPERDGGQIRYLLFDRDGSRLFVVAGVAGDTDRYWFWAVDTTAGTAELVCRCPVRLAVGPDGAVHLHEGTPPAERLGLPRYGEAGEPAKDWLGRYPDALAADGSWAELYDYDQVRVVGGGRAVPRVLQPQRNAHAVPLWLGNGMLSVAVGGDDSLRRVDGFRVDSVSLSSGKASTVTTARPVVEGYGPVLAFGALIAPAHRPAAGTGVPWWSGDRRSYYLGAVVEEVQAHPLRDLGAAVAVLVVAGLLVVRRRRRRALR